MRDFAKRIIACEANGHESAQPQIQRDFDLFEKLRPQLATLMGNDGFQALLSRALVLALVEAPWLNAIHVKSDGDLGGLKEIHAQLSSDAMFVGKVDLLAQLLGLLVAFIGEDLTLRLVLEVWPKAMINDLDLTKGNTHDKTT